MDRKTLEYMEERAEKARKIVKTIEQLQKNIESMNKVQVVRFINNNWNSEFDTSTGDLTNDMKSAYFDYATLEIDRLEQELLEL
jgi:hypothetical protein